MKAESSPPVGEAGFIKILEDKAREQQRLVQTEMIPGWARGVGDWLAVHPWRVIVPLSALIYGLLRSAYGGEFRELILGLFGGFGA